MENNSQNSIQGIHHITAIAGNAQRNHDFYTKTLALRMVSDSDPHVPVNRVYETTALGLKAATEHVFNVS